MGGKRKKAAPPPEIPERSTTVYTWDATPDRVSAAADPKAFWKAKRSWNLAVRAAAKEFMGYLPSRFMTPDALRETEANIHSIFDSRPARPNPSRPRGRPRKLISLDQILKVERELKGANPKISKARIAACLGINVKTYTRRLSERPATSK